MKKIIGQLVVIGIIALFLIETLAFSRGWGGSGATPTPTPAGSSWVGQATVQGKVVELADELLVTGADSGMKAALGGLNGVEWVNRLSDGFSLKLQSGANASVIAAAVGGLAPQAKVQTRALVSLPAKANFTTLYGAHEEADLPARMLILAEPSVAKDQQVDVLLSASMQQGSMVTLTGQMTGVAQEAMYIKRQVLNTTVTELRPQITADFSVNWENRTVAKEVVEGWLAGVLPVSNVSAQVAPASAIDLAAAPDNATADRIKALPFVTGLQGSQVAVNESFADKAAAESALFNILGPAANLTFEPSTVTALANMANVTPAEFSAAVDKAAASAPAGFFLSSVSRVGALAVPANVTIDNVTYEVPQFDPIGQIPLGVEAGSPVSAELVLFVKGDNAVYASIGGVNATKG